MDAPQALQKFKIAPLSNPRIARHWLEVDSFDSTKRNHLY
jgi:hypothetical protein